MRATLRGTARELLGSRELLLNLTKRELKVRYRRSVLGFVWSLLNPLLMMGVFSLVFGVAFKAPIHDFPLFFLSGYLAWAFFQASTQVATGTVVVNSSLVTKVYFRRELLPLSIVLSQLVHFALALLVLFSALAIRGYNFLPYLPVLLAGIVLLAIFTTGMALAFSAANTVFRDIQELSGVLFLLWFYLTPVVYQPSQLPARYRWALNLNPMKHYLTIVRNSLYDLRLPSAGTFAAAIISSIASLVFGAWLFAWLSARFAKEV